MEDILSDTTHGSTNSFDYRACSGLDHMRMHMYMYSHTHMQAYTRAKPVIGNSSTPVSSFQLKFYKHKRIRSWFLYGRKGEGGRKRERKTKPRILLYRIFYVRQNCSAIAWSISNVLDSHSKRELPLLRSERQMSQFISFLYVREYAST